MLKFLGNCPCIQCLVEKEKIFQMGSKLDMRCRRKKQRVDGHPRQVSVRNARRQIFQFGRLVNSKIIDNIMVHSSVPIEVSLFSFSLLYNILIISQNAFSTHLLPFSFNFYSMLVVDLLHEFELGVWKAILTHLICILYAAGEDKVGLMNARYVISVSMFQLGIDQLQIPQSPIFWSNDHPHTIY